MATPTTTRQIARRGRRECGHPVPLRGGHHAAARAANDGPAAKRRPSSRAAPRTGPRPATQLPRTRRGTCRRAAISPRRTSSASRPPGTSPAEHDPRRDRPDAARRVGPIRRVDAVGTRRHRVLRERRDERVARARRRAGSARPSPRRPPPSIPELEPDGHRGVHREVACPPRGRPALEPDAPVKPGGPERHQVRPAVRSRRRDPVGLGRHQPFLGPGPRQRARRCPERRMTGTYGRSVRGGFGWPVMRFLRWWGRPQFSTPGPVVARWAAEARRGPPQAADWRRRPTALGRASPDPHPRQTRSSNVPSTPRPRRHNGGLRRPATTRGWAPERRAGRGER